MASDLPVTAAHRHELKRPSLVERYDDGRIELLACEPVYAPLFFSKSGSAFSFHVFTVLESEFLILQYILKVRYIVVCNNALLAGCFPELPQGPCCEGIAEGECQWRRQRHVHHLEAYLVHKLRWSAGSTSVQQGQRAKSLPLNSWIMYIVHSTDRPRISAILGGVNPWAECSITCACMGVYAIVDSNLSVKPEYSHRITALD